MINKKGFTLIEVVVVTLIIAVLALLVAPSFKNSAMTNQMEKAKIGLVELTTAVKLYNEVHEADPISGVFNVENYQKLTQEDTEQGYVYLQNAAGRWGFRPGSSTDYSLWGGDAVLDCQYVIGGVGDSVLASTTCRFYNQEDDVEECYTFSINRTNPAVIEKARLDNCE